MLPHRTIPMRFPLADWIDAHGDCRYQLGSSGMVGSIRHPVPTRAQVRDAHSEELVQRLADLHEVDPRRVFLAPGATEANTSVLFFLAHRSRSERRRCRVRFPEYPPLYDTARYAGWAPTVSGARAPVGVLSHPRNPEGTVWSWSEIDGWAEGIDELLVDETFREFSGRRSATVGLPRPCWASGSFTKFFGADDLRVGYVVAPEGSWQDFARFHGLLYDSLPPYSIAGALACLDALPRMRRTVGRVLRANVEALQAQLPGTPSPSAPVCFDRVPGIDGDRVAQACLAASVLVCPGSLFGDPSGVRICLTSRSFPRDLAAYVRVRTGLAGKGLTSRRSDGRRTRARPLPAVAARGRDAPG